MYIERILKALDAGNIKKARQLVLKQDAWQRITDNEWAGLKGEYVSIIRVEEKNGSLHATAAYRRRKELVRFIDGFSVKTN